MPSDTSLRLKWEYDRVGGNIPKYFLPEQQPLPRIEDIRKGQHEAPDPRPFFLRRFREGKLAHRPEAWRGLSHHQPSPLMLQIGTLRAREGMHKAVCRGRVQSPLEASVVVMPVSLLTWCQFPSGAGSREG